MKNRIFRGIFSVAILVWIACLVLILGALYLQYNGQYAKELRMQSNLLARAVEIGGAAYLDKLILEENHRITLIAEDGTVKYDSSAGTQELENHRDRPEVKEAEEKGYGEEVRYSKTLAEKTMYCAVRLSDGSVLRVSQVQFTIFTLILTMLQPILIILLMAVLLSAVLAARISKRIVEPLNRINLEDPDVSQTYEEVHPLVRRIAEQKLALDRKISRLQTDVDEKTREAEFRKEFTANVSHELKTPLTSISGFAEIIKAGMVKEEDVPRFAGRIYDESQRLITLVEDIIKLSQLDEGRIGEEKEKVDLYLLCQNVLAHLDKAADDRNIQLLLTGESLYAEVTVQIVEEMIYNLCDNAIKYNREGGSVTVSVFEKEGRPTVSVTDTGIGIAQEELERVFERFYRVNKSHSKDIGGTGLGLSIVKHGAAYHQAKIQMESKPDVGTHISIQF